MRNSKKTADGNITHLWDGTNIVADMNGNWVETRYVRGIGLIMSDGSEGQKYYLYNGHGDVVQLAGTNGVVLWQYDYDAFGNEREIAGQDAEIDRNPFRYCGEYFDKETGSIYLRARLYQPSTGRFLTEDPIRSGLNWYAYCSGNPILLIDPLGLAFIPLRTTAESDPFRFTIGWNAATRTATVYGGPTGAFSFTDGMGGPGRETYISALGIMYVWDETFYSNAMLTSSDKTANVKVASVNGSWYKDFSNPINTALRNAEPVFKALGHLENPIWFKGQVQDGAVWDIKLSGSWNKTIADGTFPGRHDTPIVVNGVIRTPEELGNMTYGYLGTACGFAQDTLLSGGDYADGGVRGVFTQSDSPEDKAAIIKGVNWYNNLYNIRPGTMPRRDR